MNVLVEDDIECELFELHEHWGEIQPPKSGNSRSLTEQKNKNESSPGDPGGGRPSCSSTRQSTTGTSSSNFDYGRLALIDMEPEEPKQKKPKVVVNNDPKCLQLPPDESLTTEILKHNIRLNKHVKDMMRLIRSLSNNPANVVECPTIPTMTKCKRAERPVAESEEQRRFGRSQTLPASVDDEVIQKMLEKSVIMVLAQIGFDRIEKSALLVFVDVVKEMLYKVSLMSHELNQKDLVEGKASYKDVLEKAFRSVGFSGIDCIKEYFKKTIFAQRKIALQKSKQLTILYNQRVAEITARTAATSSGLQMNAPSTSSAHPTSFLTASASSVNEQSQ